MMNLSSQFSGVAARPVAPAAEGARSYQAQRGMPSGRESYGLTVATPDVVSRVAAAYGKLPEHQNSALPAFHAMREEVKSQFDHLTRPRKRGGMGFEVGVTKEDPYGNPNEGGTKAFLGDIANRRINVLSTATTGGHGVFSDDENDMFRAVHDVFGHGATGRGVDRHGEEAAFQKHARMFSPLARRALATETRGQNHAMIAAGGQFQPQKVALLPGRLSSTSLTAGGSSAARAKAMLQAQQFHAQQGL